ncbi:MAG: hypothetical protein GXP39_02755 [Chloroflexi bacterium]|nr:hypothetical protein [Chloroflexota bacterium]
MKARSQRDEPDRELLVVLQELDATLQQLRREGFLAPAGGMGRFLFYRFLGGIAAGLGSVIGATVVLGLLIALVRQLQLLPVVGRVIAEIVRLVQANLLQP